MTPRGNKTLEIVLPELMVAQLAEQKKTNALLQKLVDEDAAEGPAERYLIGARGDLLRHLLLIALIAGSLLCGGASAWLDRYDHRMPSPINNTGDNLTYYQYNFTADTASLVVAGMMDANVSYCRITNATDVLQSFWNEMEFTDLSTKIWVNGSSLNNTTNTTNYLYYGNSEANDASNGDNTFEFFNDFSGWQWEQLADMPLAIEQHGFEELDGILYVVCGRRLGGHSNGTYAYNISSNSWTQKADVPISVQSPVLRAVNGKLYLIGGFESWIPEWYNTTYEYDPTTDAWTQKADMPTAREDMASAVVGGMIYVMGGLTRGYRLNITEVYDPTNNTWSTVADMPDYKWSGDFGVSYNNKIYLISSTNVTIDYPILYPVATVYEYDPSGDTWTRKCDIPTARCYKEVEEIDGKIYVMSGSTDSCSTCSAKNEIYDINTNSWCTGTDTPYAAQGTALTKYNGRIYICGGMNGSRLKYLYRFNPNPTSEILDQTEWTEHEKAIEDFNKTLELDPNYTKAHYKREITPNKLGGGRGIIGFESIFAITGLLAVTYLLRRRK